MIELRASIGSDLVVEKLQTNHIPKKGETIKFKGKNLLIVDIVYEIDYCGFGKSYSCGNIIIKACE